MSKKTPFLVYSFILSITFIAVNLYASEDLYKRLYEKFRTELPEIAHYIVIDNSGSMKKYGYDAEVLKSLPDIISSYKGEDKIVIYSFDEYPAIIYEGKISDLNIEEIKSRMSFKGKYTDIAYAISKLLMRLQSQEPSRIVSVLFISDGKNEPSPQSEYKDEGSFSKIMATCRDISKNKNLFIYSFGLGGESDPGFITRLCPDTIVEIRRDKRLDISAIKKTFLKKILMEAINKEINKLVDIVPLEKEINLEEIKKEIPLKANIVSNKTVLVDNVIFNGERITLEPGAKKDIVIKSGIDLNPPFSIIKKRDKKTYTYSTNLEINTELKNDIERLFNIKIPEKIERKFDYSIKYEYGFGLYNLLLILFIPFVIFIFMKCKAIRPSFSLIEKLKIEGDEQLSKEINENLNKDRISLRNLEIRVEMDKYRKDLVLKIKKSDESDWEVHRGHFEYEIDDNIKITGKIPYMKIGFKTLKFSLLLTGYISLLLVLYIIRI